MARRLPQPQQRLEDLHLRAVDAARARRAPAASAGSGRAARRRARRCGALELAVERLLGSRRQLRRDLLLRPPQDERPQRRAPAARRSSSPSPRDRRSRAERGRAAPSSPGFRNSNRLHSSPRWFSIGVPLSARRCRAAQQPRRLRRRGRRVLDRLRLVENGVVELDVGKRHARRGAACRRWSAPGRRRRSDARGSRDPARCSRGPSAPARTAPPPAAS